MLLENFGYFWFVVEGRIVHDHQACRVERGQQHFLDPCDHGQVGTSFVKQHGSNPVLAALSHDEIGSLALITGYPAEDFSAPGRPAMRAVHVGGKATLVEINNVLPAMSGNPTPQLAKIRNSFFVTTFSVPGRFF